ncbi:ABC transporter permease [Crassaminicella profunda]|uniref:ABC transporter permease n=1 Tax=Crassaminicella profunda TaxID=1286698 RepID=UPI001CA69211|nr:ABC transporter permease [Crassaminicella profunda]QZY55979.1 ABC transporter permease [Crassaminicella profunda]
MQGEGISYLSIISLFFLIIPVVILNHKLNMHINKKIFYVIFRMVIQLSLVGIFLQTIFDKNHSLINFLYLVFMIVVASFSTAKSSGLSMKKFVFPLFLAFLIPNVAVLLYFNSFVINLDHLFHAQYLIPIGGMLLGNSLNGNIICINNFYKAIKENEKEYFYYLSLSGSKIEVLMVYFKEAIFSSVRPTIASIETIGLVALPGMMTGQILGGAIPLTAIKYQIAIMIAIFIARYFSAMLSILFTVFYAFDEYDRLMI